MSETGLAGLMDKPVKRLTAPDVAASKGRRRLAMVTAYDATFAQMAEEAGVDMVLVGDSLGMVVQGHSNTVPVSVEDVVYHCRAVASRLRHAHLVADMPFFSCSGGVDKAFAAVGAVMQRGGAHAVKIEGGVFMADTVAQLCAAGVPVMAHVGMRPQHVHAMGSFGVRGKGADEAAAIRADAAALVQAGAYAVLLENIPETLATAMTQELAVPTIGIGAGGGCDGQVLVIYDLLGLTPPPRPRVAKCYDDFYQRGLDALGRFCEEVRTSRFP